MGSSRIDEMVLTCGRFGRATFTPMRYVRALTICLTAALLVCGCADARVKTSTSTVSIGQQLIDLQTSFKNGAMNQDQYTKAKQDLIKRALAN